MDVSATLAADLAVLTQALDDPGIDLEAELRAFIADLTHAVGSYTGLTMTIALDHHEISFIVQEDAPSEPATSLLIPLLAIASDEVAGTLLLHAATPGAFVDLAADLSYALGLDPANLVLDGHLAPAAPSARVTGLDDYATINRAIGVLMDHGHTRRSARAELHRLATVEHHSPRAAAQAILRTASSAPKDPA